MKGRLNLLPKTRLLQAPGDLVDTFGEGMTSDDLIKKLKAANSRISTPVPDAYGWYPGKAAGMTAIWLGPPSEARGRKICAFHLGMIPEFTQVDPEGEMTRRGWRSILVKVLKMGAATKINLERIFKTDLTLGEKEKVCTKCREVGKINRDIRKTGLCNFHHYAIAAAHLTVNHNKETSCQY